MSKRIPPGAQVYEATDVFKEVVVVAVCTLQLVKSRCADCREPFEQRVTRTKVEK